MGYICDEMKAIENLPALARRLAIPALAVFLSCGAEDRPLNVIIIGIDTLRADHLLCYGYGRPTSPNIDEFAATGVLFENTVSQAPWTTPSFATVFTSLYPSQHGSMHVNSKVRSTVPTLATMLKERGYATGAIINAPALKPEFGLDRGFDLYSMTPLEGRVADGTTADALKWIDEHSKEPFFIFVHYFDPHLPYAPPPQYEDLFHPGYEGRIKNPFDLEGFDLVRPTLFEQMKTLTAEDWAEIVDLYDGEIVFADSAVGALLRGLEERGLRGNTLTVLLSDHGEEFFEHGGFEHGHTLYEEQIHVPLIISLPGRIREGARVERQVRLLDVTPTVLDMLGLERQPQFEGVSLVPILTGEGSVHDQPHGVLPPQMAFSEGMRHGPEMKAITARPRKLIYNMLTEDRELYDLADDPGETRNLHPAGNGSQSMLEHALWQTMFDVDDTWYIEMAVDGKPHSFDIMVKSQRGPALGQIYLPRLILPDGRFVEVEHMPPQTSEQNLLVIQGLVVEDRVRLGFKAVPVEIPLTFEFKVDGQPALGETYLGSSLARTTEMPFVLIPRREQMRARGRPAKAPPEKPYVALWLAESPFTGDTGLKLSDETKRELRSLGYIQ